MIYITECSVGEMLKLGRKIPFDNKVEYINKLMSVGLDVLDCGYFNTHIVELVSMIDRNPSITKIAVWAEDLIMIERTLRYSNIDILNFFLDNKGKEEFSKIRVISEVVKKESKDLNIYFPMLSFNFEWRDFIKFIDYCEKYEIHNIYMSFDNTILFRNISLFKVFLREYSDTKLGVRFYTENRDTLEILKVLYQFGFHKFDVAINGVGGHLPIEKLVNFIMKENFSHHINLLNLESSWNTAKKIFEW